MISSRKIKNVAIEINEILIDSASANLSVKDSVALEKAKRILERIADRVAKKETASQ